MYFFSLFGPTESFSTFPLLIATGGSIPLTGLILRCAGKYGNPFQTTQGNRLSCRDEEGRRGSEEAVPGPSVFPSGDLEEGRATHSSILAWIIPWTEDPGGLQSIRL